MLSHSGFFSRKGWHLTLTLFTFFVGLSFSFSGTGRDNKETRFDGYLFAKLAAIGSKSEGPKYFLQQWDEKEIVVIKKVALWKDDPTLHKFLGKKVTIQGELQSDCILYQEIMDLQPLGQADKKLILDLWLNLDGNVLWINKMPSPEPSIEQDLEIKMLVRWPYRSIWKGSCPSSQIYDFFIKQNDRIIWQWSKGKYFLQVETPVSISGGPDFKEFRVTWSFFPSDIKEEGIYTAEAIFIASGQEISKDFEIKFAQ